MLKKIIDGKMIAEKIIHKIKKKMTAIQNKKQRTPGLSVIWINQYESSKLYVKKKKFFCNLVGFKFQEWKLNKFIKEQEIINLIQKLNFDNNVDGIIIQLPLPTYLNVNNIIKYINPSKDVDGLHPYNIGCLCQKSPQLRPCTPKGIINLLKNYNIPIKGLNALIIGASNIVGRPMALELLLSGCTITITHRFTKNLKQHIQNSDLIIVAVGKPNFLNGKYIKQGSIIIDVGINKLENSNKVVGDVDFQSVYPKVSYITPVPGGVGPMTVATLLQNTLKAYHNNL